MQLCKGDFSYEISVLQTQDVFNSTAGHKLTNFLLDNKNHSMQVKPYQGEYLNSYK